MGTARPVAKADDPLTLLALGGLIQRAGSPL